MLPPTPKPINATITTKPLYEDCAPRHMPNTPAIKEVPRNATRRPSPNVQTRNTIGARSKDVQIGNEPTTSTNTPHTNAPAIMPALNAAAMFPNSLSENPNSRCMFEAASPNACAHITSKRNPVPQIAQINLTFRREMRIWSQQNYNDNGAYH
jgi:hypothetical protein